jgi:glycosyltransferase involved in cell wall biosynthesis
MAREQPVICHVLHQLYLAGAEVLAAGLARKLSHRYRFIFACLDDLGPLGDRLRNEGFEVIVLHRQPGVDWTVSKHLRRVCREHKVSLLHAHQYSPFFYAANSRGILGTLRSRPAILFTEHGRHYPDYRRPKRVWANKLMLARHDRVTAVGQFVKQALIENEGIPEQRISVIYNGIDPAQFRSAAGEDQADVDRIRRETRQELGIGPDTPVVLHVARMHPVKDHITGLAAMVNVVREMPDAQLLLAGDGVERRRLEAKANEFGIKDNVKFLGIREDVPRLMAATDVFMLCSVSEGVSVTLLEAMAAGRPVAATDVGGNGEVVGHGSAGFLSKRGNSAELGKNLLSLLRNPSLRTKMGRAGRDRLIKQFSQEQMHTAYAKLYDEMLKRVM